MQYTAEQELILSSLNKEKRELQEKLSALDKVIKRIKYGSLQLGANKVISDKVDSSLPLVSEQDSGFPLKADLKVQVIKIMDILGEAAKLNAIQDKYKEITGHYANLRETVRNLNRHQILKLIQPKNTLRGLYWVKTDWLEEDGKRLKEKHKFPGFDLIYTDDMIEFK